MFSMLGKIAADMILKYFSYVFLESRLCHFMQIVSWGDNLHEMSKPIFWEKKKKKNIISLPSAKYAHRMVQACNFVLILK